LYRALQALDSTRTAAETPEPPANVEPRVVAESPEAGSTDQPDTVPETLEQNNKS
jgi:hypothetical protein